MADLNNDDVDDNNDDNKDNEERFFHNPTYNDTHTSTTQPRVAEPTLMGHVASPINKNFPETLYDSVNLPPQSAGENGQMYDVLNRGKPNGIMIWDG